MTLTGALLDPILARDPVGPRITYYDDATGERIELSTVTLANWAAKTANLLRDELGASAGDRVAVLLPAHWQTAAVLFGTWWAGCQVVLPADAAIEADIALCTVEALDAADAAVGSGEIAVLSLDPFGKPVPDLPIGVTDYATAIRAHGDQVVPEAHPGPVLANRSVTDVLAAAQESATNRRLTQSDRVLSTASWDTADALVDNLLAVYAAGASLVQVSNADPARAQRRIETEKITREL